MINIDTQLEANRLRMVDLILEHAATEGTSSTPIEGVKVLRADHSTRREALFHPASIVLLANGCRRLYLCTRTVTYDAGNYLLLAVPLHFECETETANELPMLGLSMQIDMQILGELAVLISDARKSSTAEGSVFVSDVPLDLALSDTAVRLLEVMRSPVDSKALGPGLVKEMIYRVLCGKQGPALVAMLGRNGQFVKVLPAIQLIHQKYAEEINVADLARNAGMSVSGFHQHFKSVTTTSPLQLLKDVRLSRARMLMVHDRLTAAAAAERVGYESASQFNREFKRHFGRPPQEEAARIRSSLRLEFLKNSKLHPDAEIRSNVSS